MKKFYTEPTMKFVSINVNAIMTEQFNESYNDEGTVVGDEPLF